VYREAIFRKCNKKDIMGSKHTFYKTLNYMEKKQIILNPAISIKNHSNYTNRFYFIQGDDARKIMNDVLNRYRESIDVIFIFSSLQSDFLYIAAHEKIDHIDGKIILEDIVTEYRVIFPCKEHEKHSQRILPQFILVPEYTRDEPLVWDEKMWEIYYWLKINYRLYNSEIGKQVGISPVTVARRKEKMLPSLHIHYPVYAEGKDNYSVLFFILEDIPDLDKVLNLLSDLSATSYLVKGSKGTYLCFASTRRVHILAPKMRKAIGDESLGFSHFSSKWTPILDDYKKEKIEERFFYMFPPRTK
jgi:hypothetical protein